MQPRPKPKPAKHGENTLARRLKSNASNIRLSLVIALKLVTTALLRSCLAWENLYIQEKSIIFENLTNYYKDYKDTCNDLEYRESPKSRV